jgi:hypothetical protein
MNIAELNIGEQVLKYKSVYALQRESDEIQEWFSEEWEKAKRLDGLYKAILDGDEDVLAKAASADLEVAKAHVADLKKRYRPDIVSASLAGADRLAAIMREYTRRTAANKEDERRSRRFNDAWNTAPPGGEWLRPTIH